MTQPRIIVYGNSGSGKTTMAAALAAEFGIPHLDLDTVAWATPAVRKPVTDSVAELQAYIAANPGWIIEGCYGDLIEAILPSCTELRFLNPGVKACMRNCRARPWEPHKYATKDEQDAMLRFLLGWVSEYETRDDEFSLKRHRALFDGFTGVKREYGA